MSHSQHSVSWRLGLFAALAVTLLALIPQFRLQLTRGKEWNGFYAYFSQDEIAYSAYVNALIAGRPRRNDPYSGRDDSATSTQAESLFSIQFVPAYAIAVPARALGISASTAFILLTIIVAFASTLSIFWVLRLTTGDARLAAAGATAVLCLGTYAIVYAPLRMLLGLDTTYTFEYFPFLRRYVPAIPFPLFFVFCGLVWKSLTTEKRKKATQYAVLAGIVFALLVFSYFYTWTAAVAWLFCLGVVWLIARWQHRKPAVYVFAIVLGLAIAALVPYFLLIANRAASMDSVQLLALSHVPDLTRSSIKLGLMVCLALGVAIWKGRIAWRDPSTIFTASFALTPLLVFNQQVISGRSLQPLHYELYISKYMALLSAILAVWLWWRGRDNSQRKTPAWALALLVLVSLSWAAIETSVETKRHAWASTNRDEALEIVNRLKQISSERSDSSSAVVLYANLDHADLSPVVAPQPVLWAPHTPAFSGVTVEENRERLYQFLYYTGEDLVNIDPARISSLDYRKRYLVHSLIEWGHNDPAWTVNWRAITPEQIREALAGFARYAQSFDGERARHPTLSYVVIEGNVDLSNLDRWYVRDSEERVGRFILLRVRPRQ